MPQWDLPEDELVRYRPSLSVPDDFDDFWRRTLVESRATAKEPVFELVDNGLRLVDTYDVTFSGFGGDPVRGWLHVPAGVAGPLPVVVEYLGYNSGRSLPHEVGPWALAGYAHFVMDTRGQGWNFRPGATPDPHGSEVAFPGMMTRGIADPETYYYRRVFTDAVLAVDAVRANPLIDSARVVLTGGSQGGGICIAAAAMTDTAIAALPDAPFLCDFPRAMRLVDLNPYRELVDFLASHRHLTETVRHTLSYFDGVTMAARAHVPTLFSVSLMDDICPPSTVFAAYNAWAGEKEIRVYPFNRHECGGAHHRRVQLDWVAGLLDDSGATPQVCR